jgi:hypothetical protein
MAGGNRGLRGQRREREERERRFRGERREAHGLHRESLDLINLEQVQGFGNQGYKLPTIGNQPLP